MQQDQNNQQKLTTSDAFGLLYVVAGSHAAAITPFIRRGFGAEAFFPFGLVAFVAMLCLTGDRWGSPMGIYAITWLVTLLYRRFETFRLRRKGIVTHTRYAGYPWLAMKFVKDTEQARGCEPVICLLAGAALCPVSETLGLFVMAGFVSLGLCMCIDKFVVYKRVQKMQDAILEGEFYAGEMRRVK